MNELEKLVADISEADLSGQYLDSLLMRSIQNNPNLAIPWLLMASYLYYLRYESILSDTAFDLLCRQTLDVFNQLNHEYKHLITEPDLAAGSLFTLNDSDYPADIKSCADSLLEKTA